MKRQLAPLIVAFYFFLWVGGNGGAAAKNSTRVLSLCELVDNWKDYNQQEVRVRAIYVVGAEQTVLYDPACRGGEDLTYVEFRPHAKGATKKLDQLVAKRRSGWKRAWVILDGVFYGPEPFENVDPKLPESVRVPLEKSHRRYGHMDSLDTMLQVTRVVGATAVADE